MKELIMTLESVYLQEVHVKDPMKNPVAVGLYDEWLDHPGSSISLECLHSTYHSVEKNLINQLSD